MPVRIATYRRLLFALAALFAVSELVASFAFASGSFGQQVAGMLFAPFFAPALGGAFVIHAWARPRPKEIALVAGVGALLAALHVALGRQLHADAGFGLSVTFGLGLASLLVTATNAARNRGAARAEWLSVLLPAAVLPAFVLVSNFFLGMTALLHPMVLDASVYAADAFFGLQPSFWVGRLFARATELAVASRFVYWNLPLALAFVYGARRRYDPAHSDDVLFSFVAVGLFGFLLYHLYPVVGPTFFFVRDFPVEPVELPNPAQAYLVPIPVPRNCMPSLHTAWALLVHWQARSLRRWMRWSAAAWLAFTALGTLGFGFHYAMDLVVAVPFTLAVSALFARKWSGSELGRRGILAFGACLTVVWLVSLRFFAPVGTETLRWSAAALTVIASFAFARRLEARSAKGDEPVEAPRRGAIAALVFTTAMAAAVGCVAMAKSLTVAFGSSAVVSATMIATSLVGIALGSEIGGELDPRRKHPLRLAAIGWTGAALVWAAAPWLIAAAPSLPVAASFVLLAPATLLGISLPAMIRHVARPDVGRAVGWLSGAAWLGAALGAWLAGYVVLPFFGVRGTTWIPVLANLSAGFVALRFAAKSHAMPAGVHASSDPAARSTATVALASLAGGGLLIAALATVELHLLGAVAANSSYAMPLLTCSLAAGGAAGAAFAGWAMQKSPPGLVWLSLVLLALAMTVLGAAHVWGALPAYFASFAGYPLTRTFESRELVRFSIGAIMLAPATICMGALVPIAMDLAARGTELGTRAIGRAIGWAMLGATMGLVSAFVLVARLGSLASLEMLATGALALGVVPLVRARGRARWPGVAVAIASVVLLGIRPTFDFDALAGGADVHFQPVPHGRAVDHAESVQDGITTLSESHAASGERVLTLSSNGKLDSDATAERGAQTRFALYPLLHTASRDEALVIGLGTGASAMTVHGAGFRHLDVVEPSSARTRLASVHFEDARRAIFEAPGIDLHPVDPRSFLRLTKARYDLIATGAARLWLPGSTALYSREFYRLAKARLAPEGVFEQTLPLDRVGIDDILAAMATIRAEFSRVWLYAAGSRAALIACNHDCAPTPDTLATAGGARRLLRDRLLSPEAVDQFLASTGTRGGGIESFLATDDNLLLELDTPRRNVVDRESSLESNLALLRSFATPSLVEGTRPPEQDTPGVPSGAESTPIERPGLTRDARHGKTQP